MKFLLAGLTAFAALAVAAPSGAPTPLDIRLEMTGNSKVKATITNLGKKNLKIFRLGTILDEAAIEKATVTSGDKPVKFIGIRQRIATHNLPESTFEHITAGQSIQVTFDIAHVHDLSSGGKFDVEASGILNFAEEFGTELIGSVPFYSNKISALIDGKLAATARLSFIQHKRTRLQKDCTGDKLAATKVALNNCVELSKAAERAAASGPAAKFEEYFLVSDPSTRQNVVTVFQNVAEQCGSIDSGSTSYYCSDVAGHCREGVLAYAISSESLMAYCDLYFKVLPPVTKYCHDQDQATTTIHECTHLYQVLGTADYAYGYENIQKLKEPEKRYKNADTYAMFANAIYAGC